VTLGHMTTPSFLFFFFFFFISGFDVFLTGPLEIMLPANSSPLKVSLILYNPTPNSSLRVSKVTASLKTEIGVRRTSLCLPKP
jgi:hypothetical protein